VDIDLALGILDHQMLDVDGRRCGKVDDLELTGMRTSNPTVTALLSGPSAWKHRGRLGRLAAKVARRQLVRVPWEEVAAVEVHVRLRTRATDLRLGRGDDRARRLVEQIPGASR
jgi:sporulation protein YlmC with PRC-barrel domain